MFKRTLGHIGLLGNKLIKFESMEVLFLTRCFDPHVGGVEKHVKEVSKSLIKKGYNVTILTEKYDKSLKDEERIDEIKIVRFSYPHIKLIGLKFIWWKLFLNIKLIRDADIIHIHDVFIWYLPFRILFPFKKVVTTIHGLEWDRPLDKLSLWQKKLAVKFSNKSVGIGKFLEKYLKVKFDLVSYGGDTVIHITVSKVENRYVYVGRLEKNTGLLKLLDFLRDKKYSIDFCGDGELRQECSKYGLVHGFCDPIPFLKKAEYCVPGGYLAALEALSYNCKLKLFWDGKVKEDYWKISPFVKKDVKSWAKTQTWEKLANEYIDLYHNI